jgi:hypothetical protein
VPEPNARNARPTVTAISISAPKKAVTDSSGSISFLLSSLAVMRHPPLSLPRSPAGEVIVIR